MAETPNTPPSVDTEVIERVRLEERGRLSASLAALQAEFDKARADKDRLAAQVTTLQTQLSSIVPAKPGEGSGTTPPDAVDIEATVNRAIAMTAKAHEEKFAQLTSQLEAEKKAREAAELRAIREKLIAEAGPDNCVAEMVVGSSESELRAALERSKQTVNRIRETVTGGRSTPASVPPASGAAGGSAPPAPEDELLKNVRTMSREEFGKHREALKARALATMGRTSVM